MLDRYNNRKPSTGTLYLTATHLIFVDPDAKKETWVKTFISSVPQSHSTFTIGWLRITGAVDARRSGAETAAVHRRCSAADPLQDVSVGDVCVAERTRVPRPLHLFDANVSAVYAKSTTSPLTCNIDV